MDKKIIQKIGCGIFGIISLYLFSFVMGTMMEKDVRFWLIYANSGATGAILIFLNVILWWWVTLK